MAQKEGQKDKVKIQNLETVSWQKKILGVHHCLFLLSSTLHLGFSPWKDCILVIIREENVCFLRMRMKNIRNHQEVMHSILIWSLIDKSLRMIILEWFNVHFDGSIPILEWLHPNVRMVESESLDGSTHRKNTHVWSFLYISVVQWLHITSTWVYLKLPLKTMIILIVGDHVQMLLSHGVWSIGH